MHTSIGIQILVIHFHTSFYNFIVNPIMSAAVGTKKIQMQLKLEQDNIFQNSLTKYHPLFILVGQRLSPSIKHVDS